MSKTNWHRPFSPTILETTVPKDFINIINKIGDEVLSDLVATMHPYQSFSPKEQRTYDRNPKSLACVSPGDEGEFYYAGGFNGGSTKEFLKMSEVIANRVTKELQHDIIPLWHDESHLNRYFVDNPPTKTLDCGYCAPESAWEIPFPKKVLALDKSVDELKGR